MIAAATIALLWAGSVPRHSSITQNAAGAALVQIAYDEHLESQELEEYCINEMAAVERLMSTVQNLTGTSLLWTLNQVSIRLGNTASLA